MTTLIIARHGNTFGPHDAVTYVGGKTDLPLVEKGIEQAKALGRYLKDKSLIPAVVYASTLQRTIQTAEIAIRETGVPNPVFSLEIFNEIDYGPDENKTREEVLARIGEQAHKDWEEKNIVPPGWNFNPQETIQNWKKFADQIRLHDDNEIALVVTSNGIARFAPHITEDYEGFSSRYSPKLATGALCLLSFNRGWQVLEWNRTPQ